jgi:Phage integrase family
MSQELARVLRRLEVDRAAETLRRGWKARPPWVFCSEVGTARDLYNVTRVFKRTLKAASLPNFRLYDLRHTFATLLLAQSAPITYVAGQLGHSKPTTTLQWYAHWLPSGRRGFVDALDDPSVVPERAVVGFEGRNRLGGCASTYQRVSQRAPSSTAPSGGNAPVAPALKGGVQSACDNTVMAW